jgi:hypothetical protein
VGASWRRRSSMRPARPPRSEATEAARLRGRRGEGCCACWPWAVIATAVSSGRSPRCRGDQRRRGRGRVGRRGVGSPRFGCRRREEQHWERELSSIGRCDTLGGATPLAARGGEGCRGSQADGRRRSARCCQSGKNIRKLKKMLAFVEAFNILCFSYH